MRARFVALLLCVASVGVVVGVPGPAASAATRNVTVSPKSNLVSNDLVTIAGTGFTPSVDVGVCEGVFPGEATTADCGAAISLVHSDASGAFSLQVSVHRFMSLGAQQVDCAAPGAACAIGAAELSDIPNTAVIVPIGFKPATGTPRPDLIFKRRDTQQLLEDNVYFAAVGSAPLHAHPIASPGTWTYAVVVQNDGDVPDDLVLTMPNVPPPPFAVRVFVGYYDVTDFITGSGVLFHAVAPGQSIVVGVGIGVGAGVAGIGVLASLKLSSGSAPELVDHTRLWVDTPPATR
jgi:hypothetical protein